MPLSPFSNSVAEDAKLCFTVEGMSKRYSLWKVCFTVEGVFTVEGMSKRYSLWKVCFTVEGVFHCGRCVSLWKA